MKRLLLLLLLVPAAVATTIEQAEITANMTETMTSVTVMYRLHSLKAEDIALRVPLDVQQVNVKIDDELRECKIETREEDKLVRCGSTKNGTSKLTMTYETKEISGPLENRIIIKYTDKLPFKVTDYRFTLKLPEGYIIPKENKQEFYLNPEATAVLSDGQRIMIQWETSDITRFSATAIIQPLKQDNEILIMGSVALATFLITATLMLGLQFIRSKKSKQKKDVMPTFIESEQRVVDLLKQAENNELWQKQLQQECGFSKAKLSRVIRNLESRGVVIKEPFGNTNKIVLKQNGNIDEETA